MKRKKESPKQSTYQKVVDKTRDLTIDEKRQLQGGGDLTND